VWAAVPEPIAQPLDIQIPDVQFRGLPADADGQLTEAAGDAIEQLIDKADVIVIGPGIGTGKGVEALVRRVLTFDRPMVVDAQAITALAGDTQAFAARDGAPTLLTPHEGELGRLLGVESSEIKARRLHYALEAARLTRSTVLLKGEDTIIALPGGDYLVAGGHRAQATAGTGDVLTGVAGALMARGLDPVLAGACAALGCSAAAERASQDLDVSGVIAEDLIDRLPQALAQKGNP
jgi:hydroxyethylthiazole kinase-like uncharacterized protein yjeF